jgi:leucyl-tRNA synthetase
MKGEGVTPQEYVGVKLELIDRPECFAEHADKKIFLVCATLRAETMYGQTNCYIKPDGEYGLFAMKNDEYFVMSQRAAKNMAYQEKTKVEKDYTNLQVVTGAELMGKRVKAPLTSYEHVYVLPLPSIKMTKGTGIVTSVPSDSPDDFAMFNDLKTKKGMREKLNVEEEWVKDFEPIPIIDIPGYGNLAALKACEEFKVSSWKDADQLAKAKELCYQKGFYEGVMCVGACNGEKVEDAKLKTKALMLESGQAIIYHEPENEVVSRTEDSCIVALVDQWLMRYGEEQWKNVVMDHVKSDNFETYNPKTENEFVKILDWLKEWGCSRTLGLGT